MRQPKPGTNRNFLVLVAVCVLIVVGSVFLRAQKDDPDHESGKADDSNGASPSAGASPSDGSSLDPNGNPLDAASGLSPLPGSEFPGLGGEGGGSSMTEVLIHLEVSSATKIGIVGFQVPASRTDPSGIARNVGTHWEMETIAYGRPDYARLFFSAGPAGNPVTCVITVDGEVTERRSTKGPYGATMCQG